MFFFRRVLNYFFRPFNLLRRIWRIKRVLFVDEPLGPSDKLLQTALCGQATPVGKTIIVISTSTVERFTFGRDPHQLSEWKRVPYQKKTAIPAVFFSII